MAIGNSPTEKPRPLTAADRNSFAFPTIKDRVPVILCKVSHGSINKGVTGSYWVSVTGNTFLRY